MPGSSATTRAWVSLTRRTGNNQVILAVLPGQAAVAIFGGTASDIRSLDRLPVGRFSGALQPGYGLVVTPNPPNVVVEMAEQGIRDLEERLSW